MTYETKMQEKATETELFNSLFSTAEVEPSLASLSLLKGTNSAI